MKSILPPTKIADLFHYFCDAITDVIFLYVLMRFLDAILSKKKITFDSMRLPSSAETSAPRTPQPGGLAQKGGPVNSQYVVLFTQRMIKVP